MLTASHSLVYTDIHSGPCSNSVPSPHQRTPLHRAAEGGFIDAVKYLVGAGGDINIKDGRAVSD